MSRLKQKIKVFADITMRIASLSTCKRRQVGCIIVTRDFSRICAIGYNGPPRGVPNDACRAGEGTCGCVHAEANAISKLSDDSEGLSLFTTLSPCEHCAGLILNRGNIATVFYLQQYRDLKGIDLILRRLDCVHLKQ
jgi:dCMP deaminase